MPKKRRSDHLGSPFVERKNKHEKEADVTEARHRLTGVLQELLNSDEESSSSHEEPPQVTKPAKKEVKPTVVRRRKRKADVDLDLKFKHTFVMKMFDRSVDLAVFGDDTPLYPICRAWIANTPRTIPEPIVVKEEMDMKTEEDAMLNLDAGLPVQDVYKLPPPSAPALPNRIPTITPAPLQGVSLDYNEEELPTAQDLLQGHIKRWTSVKKQWSESCLVNESRFAESGKILSHIFKSNQLNFANSQ